MPRFLLKTQNKFHRVLNQDFPPQQKPFVNRSGEQRTTEKPGRPGRDQRNNNQATGCKLQRGKQWLADAPAEYGCRLQQGKQ